MEAPGRDSMEVNCSPAPLAAPKPGRPPRRPLPFPHRQAFLLICVGLVAATRSINTYRSTLYTQGAVVVALSIVQGSIAFRFTGALPPGQAYDRWCCFLAGVSICVAADLLLAFVGDAL